MTTAKHSKVSDAIYLKFYNPKTTRKTILETAIETAKVLKHQERFHKVREQHTILLQELQLHNRKLASLFHSLVYKDLPVVKEIEQILKKREKEIKEKERFEKERLKEIHPKKQKIEIKKKDRLDLEIEDLQRKLKEIKFS